MKKELTAAEWRRHIEKRRQGSSLWQMIHFLGSLKLAVILLISIAIACSIATFYESRFDARVAQAHIYNAPWFFLWLILLIVNLFCVTLTRWPWRKKHYGFVITHYGIITLLVGAFIGYHFGFEASVNLNSTQGPTNRLIVPESILHVSRSGDSGLYTVPFDPDLRRPSERRPMRVTLPGPGVRLVVTDYDDYLLAEPRLVEGTGEPDAAPGVGLRFQSEAMSQELPVELLLTENANTHDFFGLAEIKWLAELPERARPDSQEVETERLETQVVLARHPQEPVVHAPKGRTGYQFYLASGRQGELLLVIESPGGLSTRYVLDDVLGQTVRVDGGKAEVEVAEFWPDFEIIDGRPATQSEELINPAVMVHLSGPESLIHERDSTPLLELAPAPDGRVRYQISRAGSVYQEGTMQVEEEISLGWADWSLRLEKALAEGVMREVVERVEPNADGEVIPGVYGFLEMRGGTRGEAEWLLSGRPNTLSVGGEIYQFGYGWRPYRMDFSIELENFEVPRDEGTEQPANFISSVVFREPDSEEEHRATIEMNYPASYPPGTWRALTGFRYKFSQASWNPEDLNESTLQVLYDPGWLPKWVGSVMICIGITIMFYFKPKDKQGKPAPGPTQPRTARREPAESNQQS